MTLAKRLLLGSAAALVATSGAHAADLGLPVAPAVDYVQICSIGSFTGFILPGSDVCFDISGFARFQATFQGEARATGITINSITTPQNDGDEVAMIGFAELNFDARTMTEYGLLRGFIRYEATSGGDAALTRAFVQFGGLTAGRADSFFDPVFTGFALGPNGGMAGDTAVDLIGYSFAVGNGVTASIALEDGEDRQVGGAAVYDESQTIPDIVAAIRVDQAWGSAKLAAALHEVDPAIPAQDEEFGYAISASANFNVPAGYTSSIGFIGTYAHGATAYIGLDRIIGGVAIPQVDALPGAGTSTSLTTAWMLGAGFEYGITEMLDLEVDGFYASVDHDELAGVTPERDGNQWSVRGSLAYRPVSGLEIRAGVSYQAFDYDSLVGGVATPVDLPDDEIAGRLRITRSF